MLAAASMTRSRPFSASFGIIAWIASIAVVDAARPGLTNFGASRASISTDQNKVALLNRVTFNQTVSQKHVDHWIVLYCVDWWELCQGIWEEYKTLAGYWERTLIANASSWQSTAVRFAEVDCTTDKALCNDNHVEEYPTLQHFQDGKLVRGWELSAGATSLSKDIAKWVRSEFTKTSAPKAASKDATHASSFGFDVYTSVKSGLHELLVLLSWNDPVQAAFGYFVLASIIVVLIWSVTTGLEIEVQTKAMGIAKCAKRITRPSALLPELPKLSEPRTIVRNSFVI